MTGKKNPLAAGPTRRHSGRKRLPAGDQHAGQYHLRDPSLMAASRRWWPMPSAPLCK